MWNLPEDIGQLKRIVTGLIAVIIILILVLVWQLSLPKVPRCKKNMTIGDLRCRIASIAYSKDPEKIKLAKKRDLIYCILNDEYQLH